VGRGWAGARLGAAKARAPTAARTRRKAGRFMEDSRVVGP
jgi:hypothetical protein